MILKFTMNKLCIVVLQCCTLQCYAFFVFRHNYCVAWWIWSIVEFPSTLEPIHWLFLAHGNFNNLWFLTNIVCVYNKDYPLCTNTLVISQLPMPMMSHNTMMSQHNFHVFLGEWKDKISCSFELVASHCNLSCPWQWGMALQWLHQVINQPNHKWQHEPSLFTNMFSSHS